MPVKVDRSHVITGKDGQTFVFNDEEVKSHKINEEITLVCSGPRCAARAGKDSPFAITWRTEDVQNDPLKLPDSFYGLIKASFDTSKPNEEIFCSPSCLKDYVSYTYVPPTPPRVQIERAKKEQAEQLARINPHLPFDGQPTTEDLDAAVKEEVAGVTASVTQHDPCEDATGYPV